MAADGRLSDLPDDLLRRILYFAPAKEAASTAVISRRWRSLWHTSGAVNLDLRSYGPTTSAALFAKREAFFHGAEAALAAAAAAGGPLTRLTFHVDRDGLHPADIASFVTHRQDADGDWAEHDMVRDLLAHPVARRVEELRLRAGAGRDADETYRLSFAALPSDALRVVHVTHAHCTDPPPPPSPPPIAAAFPRLTELELHGCTTSLTCLQSMIDAAPLLATLHLERTRVNGAIDIDSEEAYDDSWPRAERLYRMRCPAVTALVLVKCGWPESMEDLVELDMSMLRYFRFHRPVHPFTLKSHATKINLVDLHFTYGAGDGEELRVAFRRFLQSFCHAKIIKLKLDPRICFLYAPAKEQDELLGSSNSLFGELERLELEACYEPESSTMAAAMASLLRCCPVLRDLRLKFRKKPNPNLYFGCHHIRSFVESRAQVDFDRSVRPFERRRRRGISFGAGDDEEVFDIIPGLSGHSFSCLQKCLRRVSLKFRMQGGLNCFGVQLAKFFAENALVLEEMEIDDGNLKMHKHVNGVVQGWMANSSKRRGLTKYPQETPSIQTQRTHQVPPAPAGKHDGSVIQYSVFSAAIS